MKMSEHLFQFTASKIAEAAFAERDYHKERLAYWRTEQQVQIDKAKNLTATVKIREQDVTGGKRVEVYADITGVQDINWRLQTCGQKIDQHRKQADEYHLKGSAYGSQESTRSYDLDPSDVAYFRLAGGARDD